MPGFKDFVKKAKEAAEKGISMVKEAIEFEALLKDFDEVVGNIITDIMQEHGYAGAGQHEEDDTFIVKLAVNDPEKVKHIIDRDIMKRYSPKDREKILNVIPDLVIVGVHYNRKHMPKSSLLSPTATEDVTVTVDLSYFVERKGGFFSKVKRDTHKVRLGRFSFKSSDFINYETKEIDREKLREYLENKLRGFGLI